MPDKPTRDRNAPKTDTQPEPASGHPERQSVPALIEGTESKPVKSEYHNQQAVAEKPLAAWLRQPQVVLSALMLFAIIAQAIIFNLQWGAMQTAIDETKRTRELEYRAYVGVKGVVFQTRVDNPAYGDLIVISTNTGRTPGREGRIKTQIAKRDTALPENTVIDEPESAGSKIVFVPSLDFTTNAGMIPTVVADMIINTPSVALNPQPQSKTTTPPPSTLASVVPSLKPPERKSITAGWYIYGVVDYKDIFDKPHWTKFCFMIPPGGTTCSQCTTFNEAN